jgi:hypothetical protein
MAYTLAYKISIPMSEPYLLSSREVDRYVKKGTPGAYILGSLRRGEFVAEYVGRSDSDLNGRLKRHVGERYESFIFVDAESPNQAFELECYLYHDLQKYLDNLNHPDCPDDADCECPVCGRVSTLG